MPEQLIQTPADVDEVVEHAISVLTNKCAEGHPGKRHHGDHPRPSAHARSVGAHPRRLRISSITAGTTSCMSPTTA